MAEKLGFTQAGLRRIIAANAPGHLSLRDWGGNLDGYARYVARGGVPFGRYAKKAKSPKAMAKKTAVAPPPRPSLLRNVEEEMHSSLARASTARPWWFLQSHRQSRRHSVSRRRGL
jgi:hypothetical protein